MIVVVLSRHLAQICNRPIPLCAGILRLAIRDAGYLPHQLDYIQLKKIVNTTLVARFKRVRFRDYEMIREELLKFLKENQSLFVFSALRRKN